MTETGKVDPLLYHRAPKFGVAGGADETRLTAFGKDRCFQVANGLKLQTSWREELEAIFACGMEGSTNRTQASSELSARGLIHETESHKFAVTGKGLSMVIAATEEELALLARIEAEQ